MNSDISSKGFILLKRVSSDYKKKPYNLLSFIKFKFKYGLSSLSAIIGMPIIAVILSCFDTI